MARIEVVTHVEAPPGRVWEVLTDFERQGEWMTDVRRITLPNPEREGVGVVVQCETDILGFPVRDDIVVIEWQPQSVLGIRHVGRLIRGVAAFELEPTPQGTHVLWWEEAQLPLGGLTDPVAQLLVVPWVTRVFRRSLAGLKRIIESAVPAGEGA